MLHTSLKITYENLVLDQDNFYLIILSILITCFLDNVWIWYGEVTGWSLLEVKGLSNFCQENSKQFQTPVATT